MIKPLRKKHFFVWILWALILPVLALLAYAWRPDAKKILSLPIDQAHQNTNP